VNSSDSDSKMCVFVSCLFFQIICTPCCISGDEKEGRKCVGKNRTVCQVTKRLGVTLRLIGVLRCALRIVF
jgi:hypothetical protein